MREARVDHRITVAAALTALVVLALTPAASLAARRSVAPRPTFKPRIGFAMGLEPLHGAQEIVTNVASAVATCHQQYTALRDWAQQEAAYRAALAAFNKNNKKTAKDKPPKEPQRPPRPAQSCPPPSAFGIPVSALSPSAAGSA